MVERGEELRLALEARHALPVAGKCFGQQLEGDLAAEARVAGTPDLAHATHAEERNYLIWTEAGACLHLTGLLIKDRKFDSHRVGLQ